MKTNESALLILDALEFASSRLKFEKTKNEEPFINHVVKVCSLLTTIGEVANADIVRASILFELITRTSIKEVDIRGRFGNNVCDYILELNNNQTPADVHLFPSQTQSDVNVIRLADLIANVEMIMSNPPEGWDLERRKIYFNWAYKKVNELKDANRKLEQYFHCICQDQLILAESIN